MVNETKITGKSKDNKNLAIYLEEIAKYPPLDKKEELELVWKVKNGDCKAREELINRNLQVVVRIADYYLDYGMEYMDLIQEGNLILLRAIDKFDVTCGNTFNYYLRWRLFNEYVKVFERSGNRNVRISLYDKWVNVRNAIRDLDNNSERDKELYEVLKGVLSSDPNIIERAYLFIDDTYSLEEMLETDSEYPMIDEKTRRQNDYSLEDEVVKNNILGEIHSIIENTDFTDAQRRVLYLYTGFNGNEPLNFPQIANLFGITTAGVANTYKAALTKIRISSNFLRLAKLSSNLFISDDKLQEKSREYQEHFKVFTWGKRPKQGVTMVDIFPSTKSKTKVKNIIPMLTEEEQELVMKFCNGDVGQEIRTDLTLDETISIHTSILPKISEMLEENIKVYRK